MTTYVTKQKHYMMPMLVLLLIVFIAVSGFVWNDRTVTIQVDGQTHIIKTHLNSPRGIIKDAGISLGASDVVQLDSLNVQEGSTLTVLRAFPLQVQVDGKEKTVMTVPKTVQDLANELGYKEPNYVPWGDRSRIVKPNEIVMISSVTSRSQETRQMTIPVALERVRDDALPKGVVLVDQEGKEGLANVVEELLYSNGELVQRIELDRTVLQEMQPKRVREGTREIEVSRSSSRVKQVMTMEATAYLPTDGGGHGITATGVPARYGIVAVDPNVIPLGTRVYIPGYGEAIAADTGGDIVGHRIDVVIENYADAMQFGRRMVEVYIL